MKLKFLSLVLSAVLFLAGNAAFAGSYGFPQKAEDAAHTSADTGVPVWGVRSDANDTAPTSATGDYAAITLNSMGNVKAQVEPSTKSTYMLSTAYSARAASATDMFEFLGSASKTVKVIRITVAYDCTTTINPNRFFLKKLSAAGSGGTSTAYSDAQGNIVKLDSNNATVTATAKDYTANPTVATSVAMYTATTAGSSSAASSAGAQPLVLFDEHIAGQPLVLRGTSQGFVINNNGATVANSSVGVAFNVIWTEE